jgi:hypothetical protein
MAMPLATPATTESSTLYFGPWYRRSPFFGGRWPARTAAIPFLDPKKDVPKP